MRVTRKAKFLLLIGLFILFFSSRIFSNTVFTVPGYKNYVNDFAGLISSDYQTKLNALFNKIKQDTGIEVAIATFDSIGSETIEEAAVKVFEAWGIGQKGEDNGLLIILALEQRKVRIEVGYGLEGDLTDLEAKDYLDDYGVPYFKNNNFSDGFWSLSLQIAKKIAEIRNKNFNDWLSVANIGEDEIISYNRDDDVSFGSIFKILIALFFIISFFLRYAGRNLSRRGRAYYFGGGAGSGFRSFNNHSGRGGSSGFGGFGGGSSGGGGASSSF